MQHDAFTRVLGLVTGEFVPWIFAAPFHGNPPSLEESKISELFMQAFGRCILFLGAPFVLFGQ